MQYLDEPSSPLTAEKRKGTALTAVRFAVTVEIQITPLTLSQLRLLGPGKQVVPLIPLTPDDLTLQVNGSRLGRGSLLMLDQHWALRITQLGASSDSF